MESWGARRADPKPKHLLRFVQGVERLPQGCLHLQELRTLVGALPLQLRNRLLTLRGLLPKPRQLLSDCHALQPLQSSVCVHRMIAPKGELL